MTNMHIDMSKNEFNASYTLRPNHLNPNASWGDGEGTGCLFETYGEELNFVRQQDPATIWTFMDGDDGGLYVVSGYHFVNRIGYLISNEPVPDGTLIEVHIPFDPEDGQLPANGEEDA